MCSLYCDWILKPGKHGNMLSDGGSKQSRYALRVELAGLELDQVDDSFSELETLSTAAEEMSPG